MSNIEIFKVKDKNEKHHIKKGRMFDVPFRLLVVGKSQSGKSNIAVNLLLQEDSRLYRNVFSAEDISFIISFATVSVHFDQISTTLLYFSPLVISPSEYCFSYSSICFFVLFIKFSLL